MRRRDGASLALTRARVATGMKNTYTILHVSRDLKDAQSTGCRELAGPPAHQMPRRLGSSTLWCAPRGVHWIETDFSRVIEGEWSTTAASWTVQDVAQAFSTTRWVDGGVSCPRMERCPKLGHVPLGVCRVAVMGFVCVFEISWCATYFLKDVT